jgi:hypothetical protein
MRFAKSSEILCFLLDKGAPFNVMKLRPLKNQPFCPISALGSNQTRSEASALSAKYSMYSCG